MSSPEMKATIAVMINRFRTARPLSRAHREALKCNGDLPRKMWWEEGKRAVTTNKREAGNQNDGHPSI